MSLRREGWDRRIYLRLRHPEKDSHKSLIEGVVVNRETLTLGTVLPITLGLTKLGTVALGIMGRVGIAITLQIAIFNKQPTVII